MSDTKEKIIQVASELFQKKGVAETGLREIARQAGISTGTLHYHFPSKVELARAVLDQLSSELFTEPVAQNELTTCGLILELNERMVKDTEARQSFFFLLQEAIRNPEFRDQFRNSLLEWREIWTQFLAAKEVDNPEDLAVIYSSLAVGLAMTIFIDPEFDLSTLEVAIKHICEK